MARIIDRNGASFSVRVTRDDAGEPTVWLRAGDIDWGEPLLPQHGSLIVNRGDVERNTALVRAGWTLIDSETGDPLGARPDPDTVIRTVKLAPAPSGGVCISELEALRAKMTPGEYAAADGGHNWFCVIAREQRQPYGTYEVASDVAPANAAGLCAEHNAMPALLALARAVLELEQARSDSMNAHTEWSDARCGRPVWPQSTTYEPFVTTGREASARERVSRADAIVAECRSAYDAALSEVTL